MSNQSGPCMFTIPHNATGFYATYLDNESDKLSLIDSSTSSSMSVTEASVSQSVKQVW